MAVCSERREAIRRLMETLDDNAAGIGSGPYASMAKDLQHLFNLEEQRKEVDVSAFGLTMACEHPMGINSTKLISLLKDDAWVLRVVIAKKVEHEHLIAQGQPRLATIFTRQWMRAFAEAAIDRHSLLAASGLCKIRWGIRALFVMRVGMLPFVVDALNALDLKPKELFAEAWGLDPPAGDPGLGPTAEQLLQLEPRFIRWLLGVREHHEWPSVAHTWQNWTDDDVGLLELAERMGGNNVLINSPCSCARCGETNFRFMPQTKVQEAHERGVVADYGALDWFPPMLATRFVAPEPCDVHTWFERRFMRDHCKDWRRWDRPRWHLSAKALEFLERKVVNAMYCAAEPSWIECAGNQNYDGEFVRLLKEAQEEGFAASIGDRVRILTRACKRKRFDKRYEA